MKAFNWLKPKLSGMFSNDPGLVSSKLIIIFSRSLKTSWIDSHSNFCDSLYNEAWWLFFVSSWLALFWLESADMSFNSPWLLDDSPIFFSVMLEPDVDPKSLLWKSLSFVLLWSGDLSINVLGDWSTFSAFIPIISGSKDILVTRRQLHQKHNIVRSRDVLLDFIVQSVVFYKASGGTAQKKSGYYEHPDYSKEPRWVPIMIENQLLPKISSVAQIRLYSAPS